MKSFDSWNRRDFIAKPAALIAASELFNRFNFLFAQSTTTAPVAPKTGASAKPMYRTLGKTGISLPIVSGGAMNADVPGLVRRCYELGMRHFDTAAIYQQGRNEEMLGRVIKEMGVRDKVIIATKVVRQGLDPSTYDPGKTQSPVYSPAEVKAHFTQSFESSLKRLQMDYVDILYNQATDSEVDINSEGALEALTALKKQGKARFIGVSTHLPEMALKESMKLGVFDVVLATFNYTMANDAGLLKAIDDAAKKGIGIVAMKTQAGGSQRPDPTLGKPLTPASQTALLKWVLRHEAITTAIPSSSSYEQIEQNFSVAANLAYTPEEGKFISDKNFVAEAQFCRQCGKCRPDCPLGVDIPQLMRLHMYKVQYSNHWLAAETMAAIATGKGLAACDGCESCRATCRNSVNIARKIQHLKEISASGGLNV